jgi:hypothetical protein
LRHWLTLRCVLVGLVLCVAPTAALLHLLITWLPGNVTVARLSAETEACTRQVDARAEEIRAVNAALTRLNTTQGALDATASTEWLPRRERDHVFDSVAQALDDDQVSIDQLTLDDPGLYAAAGRSNLLACERVAIACTGTYAGLTRCLDRLLTLPLPLRVAHLRWSGSNGVLKLSLHVDVPFVPDDTLRNALADEARLEKENAS